MDRISLLALALASWRLASLLVNEDGPGAVFSRLRYKAGVRAVVTRGPDGRPDASKVATTPVAEAFLCLWCMSVWTAGLLALPLAPVRWLRLVLAGSAGAIIIHQAMERLDDGDTAGH